MADISQHVRQIELAARGEEVRDSIVNALEAINNESVWSADTVPTPGSTHPITSGGVWTALQNVTLEMDNVPTEGSTNAVKSGGVYEALQNVTIEMDDVPVEGSENAITSGGVWALTHNIGAIANAVTVRLNAEWEGNDPYSQVVTVAGTDVYSKVDVQPNSHAIRQLLADGVRALWFQNNNGTIVAYCLGAHPSIAMDVQCTIEKIVDSGAGEQYDQTPTEGSNRLVTSGGVYAALQNANIDVDDALSSTSEKPVQNKVIKAALDAQEESIGDVADDVAEVVTYLDNKVDKVSGKGLSTNDYTTAEKDKLAGIDVDAIANYYSGTTAYWNAQPTTVAKAKSIYIYTDYSTVDNKVVPGVKIGDGTSYLIDMPFLDAPISQLISSHLTNTTIHVTAADKARWDARTGLDVSIDNGNLVFTYT